MKGYRILVCLGSVLTIISSVESALGREFEAIHAALLGISAFLVSLIFLLEDKRGETKE